MVHELMPWLFEHPQIVIVLAIGAMIGAYAAIQGRRHKPT